MHEKLERLNTLMAEVADIRHSLALLGWDEQVCMPAGSAEERGQMMGTLGRIAHEKFVSDEMGHLLADLKSHLPELDPDSDDYRLISVTSRDFEKATCVPPAFIAEQAVVVARARQAWMEARAKSEFSIFLSHLQTIVELSQRYVSFFPPAEHPYDTLLDIYEPGMKTAEVQAIFDSLRPQQVDLVRAIGDRPQVEDDFLRGAYDEKAMWDFGVEIITTFGYDWNRGRQDPTTHPFCGGAGPDDVRITSRWVPDLPFALLFGTFHETGHALYEQGLDPRYKRTVLEGGTSLGVHESQSRLWENLVGRSRPFWEHFYPRLQSRFPARLKDVDLDRFYRGINRVKPSCIRVEADEATYNLHIMLRLELEIAMLEDSIALKDLPEIWNAKMKDYLGIVPPNDAAGVLQDVHWSGGALGYFATYALGNLISAQLWEKINEQVSGMENQLCRGDFSSLLSWLREHIHRHGRKYEPAELIQKATGSGIDPKPYLRYLRTKYEEIYGL